MATTTKAPAPKTVGKVWAALNAEPQTAAAVARTTKLAATTVRKALTALAADGQAVQATDKTWTAQPTKATAKAEAEAKAPAKAEATPKQAPAPRAPLAHAGEAVKGYEVRWPKRGFDLLKRNDKADADAPAWLVRCNAHGTTVPAGNAKEGDALGRKADRAAWCKPCKAAQ